MDTDNQDIQDAVSSPEALSTHKGCDKDLYILEQGSTQSDSLKKSAGFQHLPLGVICLQTITIGQFVLLVCGNP